MLNETTKFKCYIQNLPISGKLQIPSISLLGYRNKTMNLEWNAGGWFGGQLGGTAWILVAAALATAQDTSTGLILLIIFLAPNIVGYLLWRTQKLSCYAALQILFSLVGVFGLLAIYILERRQLWIKIQMGSSVSAAYAYYMVIFITAILMVVFYLRFGRK